MRSRSASASIERLTCCTIRLPVEEGRVYCGFVQKLLVPQRRLQFPDRWRTAERPSSPRAPVHPAPRVAKQIALLRWHGGRGLSRPQRLDGFGEVLLEPPRALSRNAAQIRWDRRSCKHQHECDQREANSSRCRRHKHVVHVESVQAENLEGYIFKRPYVVKDR